MESQDVRITVIDREGTEHHLEAPMDMGMNLMEICKSYDLPILATCGGMAMCATCQVYVESETSLPKMEDDEEAMLSEAFFVEDNSRLSCQIPITEALEGLVVRLAPEE